ncbi:uncharacterized protein N7458_005918 [Penicillium daleae]|uniref:Uncharacterized protein n=1 Tax=Penicillium daleae TaxID=63821 RepID=A0AAD6G1I7_9EURO|nr:uncharacterized protein N7458_005918 [Penicillium daleae]KAJ5449469.1 hypothetical protein N7458_005918 [Penicillium daleae]
MPSRQGEIQYPEGVDNYLLYPRHCTRGGSTTQSPPATFAGMGAALAVRDATSRCWTRRAVSWKLRGLAL